MSRQNIDVIVKIVKSLTDSKSGNSGTVQMYEQSISKENTYKKLWDNEGANGTNNNKKVMDEAIKQISWLFDREEIVNELQNKDSLVTRMFTFTPRHTVYGIHYKIGVKYTVAAGDALAKVLLSGKEFNRETFKEWKVITERQTLITDPVVDDKWLVYTLIGALKMLATKDGEYEINKDLNEKMNKILKFADKTNSTNTSKSENILPNLGGGATNFASEYEAYKNTMAIEKSSIKMIGGSDDVWAPGLDKDAVKRSTLFNEAFNAIEEELATKGKRLASNDSTQIRNAINSLAKRESNIYGELKTLEKYAQLLEKYKDKEDHEIGKALDNEKNKVTELVSKYFKNVSRADKKSSRINAVLGSLIFAIN